VAAASGCLRVPAAPPCGQAAAPGKGGNARPGGPAGKMFCQPQAGQGRRSVPGRISRPVAGPNARRRLTAQGRSSRPLGLAESDDASGRLTVVDGAMFAAALRAHSEAAAIGWRSDYGAITYETAEVPDKVRPGVMTFMEALRLRFGAFDFLASPLRWVFLECNPNGQWSHAGARPRHAASGTGGTARCRAGRGPVADRAIG